MQIHEEVHIVKIKKAILLLTMLALMLPVLAFSQTNEPAKTLIFEATASDGTEIKSYYQFLMVDIGLFMIDTCLLTSGTFELFITDSKVDSVIYKGYLPDTLVRMVRENIQKSSGLWHLNRLEAGKQFKVIQQITLNYTVLNNCGYTIETIGAATSWSTLNLIDMLLYEENYAQAGNRIFIYPVLLDNYVKR